VYIPPIVGSHCCEETSFLATCVKVAHIWYRLSEPREVCRKVWRVERTFSRRVALAGSLVAMACRKVTMKGTKEEERRILNKE
jgi:hypothetical protein